MRDRRAEEEASRELHKRLQAKSYPVAFFKEGRFEIISNVEIVEIDGVDTLLLE